MDNSAGQICNSLTMKEIGYTNIFWSCFFFFLFTKLCIQVLCPFFFLLSDFSYEFVSTIYTLGKLALYGGVNIFSKFAYLFLAYGSFSTQF